jgi:hypothetical protein
VTTLRDDPDETLMTTHLVPGQISVWHLHVACLIELARKYACSFSWIVKPSRD